MFDYYGSKKGLARFYPHPRYDTIIEPFAGSARYSLRHFEKNVILIDKYPVIIQVWRWLQKCSPQDILSLPRLKYGQNLKMFQFDDPAARLFMAFLTWGGSSGERWTMQSDSAERLEDHLREAAGSLYKIRHWKFVLGEYQTLDNAEATWFIDPPYVHGGDQYKVNNRDLDYAALGEWCKSRRGQVIVCENMDADWLEFKPLRSLIGQMGNRTVEALWSNLPTEYDMIQTTMF